MTLELLFVFFKMSLLGFGGGYVIIPLILQEVEIHHWASAAQMADTVAIAAMAPGPVAVNIAVGLGSLLMGLSGVGIAFLGTVIPCLFIVGIVATFFKKANQYIFIRDLLYGLKAVLPGVVFFAGIKLGIQNHMFFAAKKLAVGWNINLGNLYFDLKSLCLIFLILFLLIKTKIHPVLLILFAALAGILIF